MIAYGKFVLSCRPTATFLPVSQQPLHRLSLFVCYRIKRTSRPFLVRFVDQRRPWMHVGITDPYNFCRQSAFGFANSVIRRFALYFFLVNAPAADLCALTMVPSTEKRDQSSARAYTVPHLPYRSGRFRQGAPVLRIPRMPLMCWRRSCILRSQPVFSRGRQGSKSAHCLAVKSWRPFENAFQKSKRNETVCIRPGKKQGDGCRHRLRNCPKITFTTPQSFIREIISF